MKRPVIAALLSVVAVLTLASTVHAQGNLEGEGRGEVKPPPKREGFWLNAGAGWGSLGCSACGARAQGLSGGLVIGGTLGQSFLIGAGLNGWTKSDAGTTLSVASFDARFRFYTKPASNLFITVGAGVGTIGDGVTGTGVAGELGTAFVFGLGYDLRIGGTVSITPYVHFYGVKTENLDVNVGQAGLSLTLH
jgi:hypothetical protein